MCEECGKGFHTRSYLLHHIETIHEGKAKYDCEFCGKVFKAKGAMRRHQDHVRAQLEHRDRESGDQQQSVEGLPGHRSSEGDSFRL